jgi:RHS repeat-associated protein
VQQDGQVRWVQEDPVTKTKKMTDSAGAVISTIVFDPWGGAMGSPWSQNTGQQRRRFTTYERDGNEADEAMFRRYNRWHSRFDQPDPYDGSYESTDPQSFNRYAYVKNDPVNFVDPLGLDKDCKDEFGKPIDCGPPIPPENTLYTDTWAPAPWPYFLPASQSGHGPTVITLLDGPRNPQPTLPDVGPTRRNAEIMRKNYFAAKLADCIRDAKETYKKQKDEIDNQFVGRAYHIDDLSQATTLMGMLVGGRAEAKNLVGWASVKAAGKGAVKSVPATWAINVAFAYAKYAPQAIVYKQAYDEAIKSCYSYGISRSYRCREWRYSRLCCWREFCCSKR